MQGTYPSLVIKWKSLGALLIEITIELSEEGSGIEQMLVNHKALWHLTLATNAQTKAKGGTWN